jgi:polyisoprenoid-binding protein YceI
MTKWQSRSRGKELLVFSLSLLISSSSLLARERPVDLEQSTITVHVGKSGLFSAAGHEHTVSAPIGAGAINDSESGHVWFRVDTAKMTVLPEKDQEAVQSTMQRSVLESTKFPEINFESTSIRKIGDRRWTVIGNLTLHGETRSITVDVHSDGGAYFGESKIRQTKFGIHPVSAAGGTVKVKDELKIDFRMVVDKQSDLCS